MKVYRVFQGVRFGKEEFPDGHTPNNIWLDPYLAAIPEVQLSRWRLADDICVRFQWKHRLWGGGENRSSFTDDAPLLSVFTRHSSFLYLVIDAHDSATFPYLAHKNSVACVSTDLMSAFYCSNIRERIFPLWILEWRQPSLFHEMLLQCLLQTDHEWPENHLLSLFFCCCPNVYHCSFFHWWRHYHWDTIAHFTHAVVKVN